MHDIIVSYNNAIRLKMLYEMHTRKIRLPNTTSNILESIGYRNYQSVYLSVLAP
jgi:hypothetical protein